MKAWISCVRAAAGTTAGLRGPAPPGVAGELGFSGRCGKDGV